MLKRYDYLSSNFEHRILFTHKGCSDGKMCEHVFKKAFGISENVVVCMVTHKDEDFVKEFLSFYKNKENVEVFFSDIVFSKSLHLMIDKTFGRQIIVDHHVTAHNRLFSIVENYVYGFESASMLLCRFLDCGSKFEKNSIEAAFMRAVSRVDIGDFSVNDDQCAYCILEQYKSLDLLLLDYYDYVDVVEDGRIIVAANNNQISLMQSNAHPIDLCGHSGIALNTSILTGQASNLLLKNNLYVDFACCYWFNGDSINFSLRSEESRNCDVSEIALNYGGGGHKCAAGFSTTFERIGKELFYVKTG